MMYHVNIINLFQPFLDCEHSIQKTRPYQDRARSVTSTSLKEIRRLLVLHDARHGWIDAITLVLHPITVASFGSIEEMSLGGLTPGPMQLNDSEPYLGLLTCLRALGSLSSYSYYAQLLFRLLTQKCQTRGIQLPVELQSTLDYYKSDSWTKNAVSVVSSSYIADMRKIMTDAESARMDAIISGWEALSLDEAGREQ